ncbi:hypothetical protein O1611_g1811 [Lasiodiplodia mahajangana]|uniref:Uncharacterized protein n=1 Tax=Lasiodiplodia mahajangana TaxID=1108764 RepID=A0ACC2JWA8_9PEZI|nr:hypothetical protein O1611_g1811 [Lasiodiplodia mahajangana]
MKLSLTVPSATDLIIPVMGMTGVGKSSLVTRLADREAGIGHGLVSFTTDIRVYRVQNTGHTIYLIDTPGFDDTYRTNVEIFKELAFMLSQLYLSGARLGGILYLHRITDNRVTRSAVRGFNTLKQMCGPAAARFVTLVTTMWDCIPPSGELQAIALRREQELRETDIFWGSMFRNGSGMVRWPADTNSPLDFVHALADLAVQDGPVILQIQREIVDWKCAIEDTTAGRELIKEYAESSRISLQELRKLKVEFTKAEISRDFEASLAIEMQKRSLEARMREEEAAEKSLRVSVEALFQAKKEAYMKLYTEDQNEEREIGQEIETDSRKCQRMRNDMRHNTELYDSETRTYRDRRAKTTALVDRQQLDQIQRHMEQQYQQLQSEVNDKLKAMMTKVERGKKRRALKRNALPILGILAGVVTIAAGAATAQIPVVTVGISVFAAAMSKLKAARRKKKDEEEGWDIQEGL